jgi:phosphoserine phosphatase
LLDADLRNITPAKIKRIIMPVLKDEVDVSRAGFRLARGRVTEIAVKPMMRILFPEVNFNQPISGQVCAKKEFLEKVNLEDRWGVDIGILLDAIQAGQRIVEVNIGELEHKARTDQEKAEMAQQVMETMIEKAGLIRHKYKLITFTLDNTLIQANTLKWIFIKLGVYDDIVKLQDQLDKKRITQKAFIIRSAALFKDRTLKEIEEISLKAPLAKYSKEIIAALIRRKYQVGLISTNFSPIVFPITKNLGINNIDCIHLEAIRGKLTGKITKQSQERWLIEDSVSLNKSFNRIRNRAQAKPTEVIVIANSAKILPIIPKVGFSIGFNPKDPELRERADKTIHVLPELLAIIE